MLGRRTGGLARPERSEGDGWTVVSFASVLSGTLRQIAGMPDYPAYVEHLRRCHPDRAIPSEGQFYNDFIRSRYADGPTRCC